MNMMSSQGASVGRAFKGVLRPELSLVILMVVIIAMMIIPLPTPLVDTLIGLNIALSVVIFLSSFYVERIIGFSTFPSVLLFTTLLRLALSVSTSRLILLDADAGHIIAAFGDFVVGDNLVVGAVIFAIITLVQFIVITKGSERIGEVVARFSLDGMPGKQMSIDADLRAEAITSEQAQARRRDVERESQLYGSFDGAMKFVKGDAIAGIVIVFVNLFGGLAVGMLQHGMGAQEALRTFTLLTIGDGLVAQIPALLICISAGFIVTRVGGDGKNLGAGIVHELLGNNLVLGVGAVLVLFMGLLPGFPLPVFVLLAAGMVVLLVLRRRATGKAERDGDAAGTGGGAGGGSAADRGGDKEGRSSAMATETLPLLMLVPPALQERSEADDWDRRLHDDVYIRIGLQLPQLAIKAVEHLPPHAVQVLIHEIPAAGGVVVAGCSRILGRQDELETMAIGLPVPSEHGVGRWIGAKEVQGVRDLGYDVASDYDEFLRLVHASVIRHIGELFGIQEAKTMLDGVERRFPELVKETYRHMPVQRVSEVLQRLLREDVSVRNMRVVLETLAQWGQREKDVLLLVEHVRGGLARYISARFATAGRIAAVVVSTEIEDLFRSGIRQSPGGAFLSMEPAQSSDLMERVVMHVHDVTAMRPDVVLLVAPDIRRFVKRFIEGRLPTTPVLSFSEIADTTSIDIMRSI